MTELLYLKDCYLKETTAKVTNISVHDGTILVELDQTIFYPTGGGQPHDEGTLQLAADETNVFVVSSVYKFKEKVFHVVDKPGLKVGDEVLCKIDWERRYTHMRMHTAAHIISDLFEADEGTLVSGNQLGLDKSRIDLTLEHFDRDHMQSFEAKSNEVIKKSYPIKKYFLSREEAEQDPGLFTLLKGFSDEIK
ncbi:alanyl-tRNA editing protein, partial [Candidatus Woesearchaeota archaeon]|nr:alanyl-tRNA editing protein [Candidatus Woesearchaeota archaeon]